MMTARARLAAGLPCLSCASGMIDHQAAQVLHPYLQACKVVSGDKFVICNRHKHGTDGQTVFCT